MTVFEPYTLGNLTLKNKIVMAPMTRSRAIDNIPNDLMVTYYEQRSDAGLIISEGVSPSINGTGYARIPGAYTEAQIQGWEKIASAIHAKESKLFVQLMHCGRSSAKVNQPEGARTIAPSSVQLEGEIYTDQGMAPYDIPEAMSIEDIKTTQNDFVQAAAKLIKAGVDGIELHSANGYLLDQFLNPVTNQRTDDYGGDYKNRVRFVLETVQQTVEAIGANKIGVRISPHGAFNSMAHEYEDLVAMYSYFAEELNKLQIAYLHIVDHRPMGAPDFSTDVLARLRNIFKGTIISGGGVTSAQQAQDYLNKGNDLVYIGRPYISNPNLVEKLKQERELTPPNMDTFYTPGVLGYTDYALF
ncbi:alkene reductase [Aquimarina rhabdastrellae]